ncbi:MAG: cupin domain-containing protein [Dehalococcoidia bacterium]
MRVRRIVTGNDTEGRSEVVSDGFSPGHFDLITDEFDVLWQTDSTPPDLSGTRDPADVERFAQLPPPGGINWVVLRVPPQAQADTVDRTSPEFAEAMARFDTGGTEEPGGAGWHTTNTLDFVTVVSGRIDLELDDGVHHLGPGDCVVQRGTRHRWVNPYDQPCVMTGVLISAE